MLLINFLAIFQQDIKKDTLIYLCKLQVSYFAIITPFEHMLS